MPAVGTVTGEVVEIHDVVSGVTGGGKPWKNLSFVVRTEEQYPASVCMTIFGDKCEEHGMDVGDKVRVTFNAESKWYNGKWYSTLKCVNIEDV